MNCQTRLHSTYCPTCGQPASTQRLRFRKLAAGLVDGLFELDFKTVRTAWHLMVRPGATARSYVDGNRVSYLSPLRYHLIVVALNIGLAALLGTTDVATAGANDGNTFWDARPLPSPLVPLSPDDLIRKKTYVEVSGNLDLAG